MEQVFRHKLVGCNSTNTPGFGTSVLLSKWLFHLGDLEGGEKAIQDVSEWQNVKIPHDWSVEQYASPNLASCTGYLPGGIAWYHTMVDIDQSKKNKRMHIYFEGVYNKSEVFINGHPLGKRPNGYVSFLYDITSYLHIGEKNLIVVKVDHSEDADSRWYTGSGIYRNVHLIESEHIHFDLYGVHYTTNVEQDGKAIVTVCSNIKNFLATAAKIEVRHELSDDSGAVVAESQTDLSVEGENSAVSNQILTVINPKLWSVDIPNLYILKTILISNGDILDVNITRVGIRTFTFDANQGFALNGKSMKIKGVCLHHDAGVLGAAVPDELWYERILKLKQIGCNGVRMSHNPQSTVLYDICDELGMLVMDEAFDEWEYPKKKWLAGWNIGEPGFQGAASYFLDWWKIDLESIICRDRNHPSIIMWSIGNEVDYPNDPYSHLILDEEGIGQFHVQGYQKSQPHADRLGKIAKELVKVVKKNDSSRPITAALAGAVMSNETDYPGALDIVGYNYTEGRYGIDHVKYPQRVLYGSENGHGLDAWKAVRDNDYISGMFIWTGFDYLGEAGIWPSRGFLTGLIDLANNIKPRGYFRQSLWSEKPMAYLGTYPAPLSSQRDDLSMNAPQLWNYEDGQNIRVVCYTNASEAQLLLNGQAIGERKIKDDETAIIHWDIQFESGKLEVITYNTGKKAASDSIVTSGRPFALKIASITADLKKKDDVAIIRVIVVDQNGYHVKLADNEVLCTISGPGNLLGLENAVDNAAEIGRCGRCRLKNGKLLAYVQATDNTGEIEVTFSSPYLKKATTEKNGSS
ncbi:MAG: DUF4982 domain-containing protein [Kiritimatiellae bacterium]|jgi:beta-galactosidase|nr:DUF4982 domain-containing protein [Kiritimatiellia bacterium]